MKENFAEIVWHNLLTLILLNIVYVISSVLIITIPAATAGLYRGVFCCLSGRKNALAEYWKTFRRSIISALPAGLLFGAIITASAYGCVFYRMNYSGEFMLLTVSVFCLIVLYLGYAALTYAFTMYAAVELPWKTLIKNAFLLLFADVKRLFTWPMLSAAVLLCSILLFPRSLAILLLLSFSVAALLGARGALPLIRQFILEEDNE